MDDVDDQDLMLHHAANIVRARDHCYVDAAERIRFQASFAEKLLHALMIANGGAIVGLFTFLGNLIGKEGAPIDVSIRPLWISFACFVVGLALTLSGHILAFLSQQMFYYQSIEEIRRYDRTLATNEIQRDLTLEADHNKKGTRFYVFGLFMGAGSILLFVAGCGSALYGLLPK